MNGVESQVNNARLNAGRHHMITKTGIAAAILIILLIAGGQNMMTVNASALKDNSYVTFSPDGMAWTTNFADTDCRWYDTDTQVTTGITSNLRDPEEGEHYYQYNRTGVVPVKQWKVTYRTGTCCHNSYPDGYYHGIHYGLQCCFARYYSGWTAYCADCGEAVNKAYIYMSKEAAASLKELDMNLHYYYLCPFCSNLEQGRGFEHKCRQVSMNRYQVRYHANRGSGFMNKSIHYYNNSTRYEGEEVVPQTHLNLNSYKRTGYEFAGWNTRQDGSGESYSDGQAIYNLTHENNGEVVLYAQWKKSASTLIIDPAGGVYKGNPGITTIQQEYGTTYLVDAADMTPPGGATIQYETLGGATINSKTVPMIFGGFTISDPFHGKLDNNVYSFRGADGDRDTLTAWYTFGSIVLPKAAKPGYSFAGWYYDSACTLYAGVAGDKVTPEQDLTLYAKWVELLLTSTDNYSVYEGTGAVDLSWSQLDGQNKTYLIYQSNDNRIWSQVHSASDPGSLKQVNQLFTYNGKKGNYTIPVSGVYEFTVNGAQGGNYGNYQGGKGGNVTARVWLNAGEQLVYEVGGQNGYNGGGKASSYGNGGGMSTIYTPRLGTFIIAAGGGGASEAGNGGAGGMNTSLSESSNGSNGMAGGGGGYKGGKAGEHIVHTHTSNCYQITDAGYIVAQSQEASWGYGSEILHYTNIDKLIINGPDINEDGNHWDWWRWGNGMENYTNLSVTEMTTSHSIMGIGFGHQYKKSGQYHDSGDLKAWRASTNGAPIPVNGNNTLEIHAWIDNWIHVYEGYVWITDQNGKEIKKIDIKSFPESSVPKYTGSQSVKCTNAKTIYCINEKITIPDGTTGIRIDFMTLQGSNAWGGINIGMIRLSGATVQTKICNLEQGQIISSKPAYGGSSNAAGTLSAQMQAGVHSGDGNISIKSVYTGFTESLSLHNVAARDEAAPEMIDMVSVSEKAGDQNRICINWSPPRDNGSVYFHKVESYLIGHMDKLSTSNITQNTLISGIKGYYYTIDESPQTTVTRNDTFTETAQVEIELQDIIRYLHVSAVDVAGNIGRTEHISLASVRSEVNWPIMTDQIKVLSDKNNIYKKNEQEYFVRADGITPFSLSFNGIVEGEARDDYQVTHMIFDCEPNDKESNRMELIVSGKPLTQADITYTAQDVRKKYNGQFTLSDAGYCVLKRSNAGRNLNITQKFMLDKSYHGETLHVIPVAGVASGNEGIIYSDHANDIKNGVYLTADAEAPIIEGTSIFEESDVIYKEQKKLEFAAKDEGSGLKEFYAVITNTDNASQEVISSENGKLFILVSSDKAVFNGDFIVEFHAVDHVGNEKVETYGSTFFQLNVQLERCLDPHSNRYLAGESGILKIQTYGYAQRVTVEFPEEFTVWNPGLDQEYLYEPANYVSTEELVFMVPLNTSADYNYRIKVTAYKDSAKLEEYPELSVLEVSGTILDELRTRLR